VQLSASLHPVGKLRFETPTVPGGNEPYLLKAHGGLLVLQIIAMPREERMRIVENAIDDPILVLLAMLTSEERKQLLQAAEAALKDMMTR
jgi:hypothetical protein